MASNSSKGSGWTRSKQTRVQGGWSVDSKPSRNYARGQQRVFPGQSGRGSPNIRQPSRVDQYSGLHQQCTADVVRPGGPPGLSNQYYTTPYTPAPGEYAQYPSVPQGYQLAGYMLVNSEQSYGMCDAAQHVSYPVNPGLHHCGGYPWQGEHNPIQGVSYDTPPPQSPYVYTPVDLQQDKMEEKQEPAQIIFDTKSSYNYHHFVGAHGVSWLEYYPCFLDENEALERFLEALNTIKFSNHTDRQGRQLPRKIAWFGQTPYSYSGVKHESYGVEQSWPACLVRLKCQIEEHLKSNERICRIHEYIDGTVSQECDADMCQGLRESIKLGSATDSDSHIIFNSVLANLYKDNHQCVGWHSDDEYPLGSKPIIASLSLGAQRWFELRRKPKLDDLAGKERKADIKMPLVSGSLLLMAGATQDDWQHRVPKEYHDRSERINLTFRIMANEGEK